MTARSRNVSIEKLSEFRVVILEHILKISVLPKNPSVKHWKAELNSFAARLKRYHKSKSGKPNYSKKILWEYIWEDQYTELPLGFLEEYGVREIQLNLEDVKASIHEFIDQILEG